MNGIWNLSPLTKNPESSIWNRKSSTWNPESISWNPDSETVLESLTWRKPVEVGQAALNCQ